MLADGASKFIAEIRSALANADSPEHVLNLVATLIAEHVSCDRVSACYDDGSIKVVQSWGEVIKGGAEEPSIFSRSEQGLTTGTQIFSEQLFINDVDRSRAASELLEKLQELETRSFAVVPLRKGKHVVGWIEVHFRSKFHRWRKEDAFLLDILSEYGLLYLDRQIHSASGGKASMPRPVEKQDDLYRERLLEARQQYRRLLEYGNLIIVRTNAEGMVTDVIGDTETIFGVSPGELVSDLGVWGRFVPARDLRALVRSLRNVKNERTTEVSEEIRVINHRTKETRWLLIRGVPFFSDKDEFIGWEGFAVDITERHAIQNELLVQRKRLEALYEISRSLHVTMEPAVVLLKGLRALMKATGADGGFSVLIDDTSGALEVVAIEGFSHKDLEEIQFGLSRGKLFHDVVEYAEGKILGASDMQHGIRALSMMQSTMIIPLANEGQGRGLVAIFSRKENNFDQSDYDLASIGASQICSTLNQAEFYVSERRQSDALAFLYKMSHVLGQIQNPKEIAEHAFPILQEEIPCKRMWLGVMNEQGTHIVGQAGIGPGMRGAILNLQIELDLPHDFLDEALKKRQPVIYRHGQQEAECSGLNRLLSRLQPETVVLVPLTALSQVIGLLVLEPVIASPGFIQRKLPLLSSIANELGSVILARRFETRIADAEKMRMASLFASGVAHNFNNLLQAVMGQASLIEIQVPANSPLAKSAQLITEAATKGAALISQLMSFSSSSTLDRKQIPIYTMLKDSQELYRSILGNSIELVMDLQDEQGTIYGDAGQFQRAMTNLLLNSKEALHGRSDGVVRVIFRSIRLRSGEIDPELAPGSYVRIDVVDNGPGMDAEKLARCFEPFFTTKGADAGTGIGLGGSGLGLSSSYSIIKQHDGLITARSQPGSGAVFSVYLPLSRPKGAVVEAPFSKTSTGDKPLVSADVILYGIDSLSANSIATSLETVGVSTHVESQRENVLDFAASSTGQNALLVIDAEKEDARLPDLIRTVRKMNQRLKLIISCLDSKRWSGIISALGRLDDLEIIEKSLGVWALQAAIRRMMGIKRIASRTTELTVERQPNSESEPSPQVDDPRFIQQFEDE